MTENKIVRDKMPLVSVVVPIYNVELYLKECVASILSQTYKNIEVILVDDESPDLCGKYAMTMQQWTAESRLFIRKWWFV